MKELDEDAYNFRQKLYENEKTPKFSKGTVLIYRHDIWHRGSPVKEGK